MNRGGTYRYQYEKGSRKHPCPQCGKKRFVRFLDTSTGEYLPEVYGRCDREVNCGYELNPYRDGYAKMIWEKGQRIYYGNWHSIYPKNPPQPKPDPIPIPRRILEHTLKGYDQNVFVQNLLHRVVHPFEQEVLEVIIGLYYLGTIRKGYRKGAITFPFIDQTGRVRAIQVKQFDDNNHTVGTDFLHSLISKHYSKGGKALPEWLEAYQKQERKVSCLFGEHLLRHYPFNPIALVEAPKTAIYGSLYFGLPAQKDNFLWLAVYNLTSLTYDRCKALHGRDVYLFPDLSKDSRAFRLWSNKATQLEDLLPGTRFIISDFLEQHATPAEKLKGLDLADYLIKQNWRDFQKPKACKK